MLSYRSDSQFKKDFVKEVVWHRKQDAVLQGTYGTQNGHWRGCAVACSLRSLDKLEGKPLKVDYSSHSQFETKGLWPEWLARLEDRIFEGLPQEDALLWPEQIAKAVPVGVDLTPVKWKFCAWLLKEHIDSVLSLDISDELKEQVVSAIRGVLTIHQNAITTGRWDSSAASAAESAAWSAARSAASAAESAAGSARSAAWSARSAARSAAWSAESAAESAAWSAESARSAAWSAARSAESAAESAAYQKHAKKLINLLKAEGLSTPAKTTTEERKATHGTE